MSAEPILFLVHGCDCMAFPTNNLPPQQSLNNHSPWHFHGRKTPMCLLGFTPMHVMIQILLASALTLPPPYCPDNSPGSPKRTLMSLLSIHCRKRTFLESLSFSFLGELAVAHPFPNLHSFLYSFFRPIIFMQHQPCVKHCTRYRGCHKNTGI